MQWVQQTPFQWHPLQLMSKSQLSGFMMSPKRAAHHRRTSRQRYGWCRTLFLTFLRPVAGSCPAGGEGKEGPHTLCCANHQLHLQQDHWLYCKLYSRLALSWTWIVTALTATLQSFSAASKGALLEQQTDLPCFQHSWWHLIKGWTPEQLCLFER